MNKTIFLVMAMSVLSFNKPVEADIVSVNFSKTGNDANSVDAGEMGTQFAQVDGGNWNNILTSTSNVGSVVNQSFDGTNLINDMGAAAAVLNTTIGIGDGFTNFGDTSAPNQHLTGEAGLMQSHLNFGGSEPAETITVNGLGSSFTNNGYSVYLYFDFNSDRTYGFTLDDGISSSSLWTEDQASVDADADNDGNMEWLQATGTDSLSATLNGNYAVFDLQGSSFTISGLSSSGRSNLNGFQIVSSVPEPALAIVFGLLGVGMCIRRRR